MVLERNSNIPVTPDGRIRQPAAAGYLGISYLTLAEWGRAQKFGLKPIKVGRFVFFDFEQIQRIASGKINADGSLRQEA